MWSDRCRSLRPTVGVRLRAANERGLRIRSIAEQDVADAHVTHDFTPERYHQRSTTCCAAARARFSIAT
jgi:hypothetical protein